MKRSILILALIMTVSAFMTGCVAPPAGGNGKNDGVYRGEFYRPELESADQSNLYGMCYLMLENYNHFDYSKSFKALSNMGVKSIRSWMHFTSLLTDPETLNPEAVEKMKTLLAEAEKYGFQIIGMNHTNWSVDGYFTVGKARRQLYEGSKYEKWLDDYEQSWYTLVSAFPEVTYWEIDNELNNHDFMFVDGRAGEVLPTEEMAAVSADMLFRGSKGIHRANPDAITVLGGLVDTLAVNPGDPNYVLGTGNTKLFLERLYDYIDSGEHGSTYYDDFFQCAAWHPYYYRKAIDQEFIDKNNAIYEVVRRREGKDKKVFFTEFGWSEQHQSQETVASFISSIELIRNNMPYVESLHYFRLLNNLAENGQKYGLYYDPKSNSQDKDPATGLVATGKPKTTAYAFQAAAGGSGELDLSKL